MGTQSNAHFDRQAGNWDQSPEIQERNRILAEALRRAIPLDRGWSALEIGAGTGQLGLGLAPELRRMVLADASAKMVEVQLRKRAELGLGNVECVAAALGEPHFPAGPFDLAFSAMAFHHFPDVDAALRGIASLQAPGAWLAIVDLEPEDGSFHASAPELPVHRGFDPKGFAERVAAAGYGAVSTATVHRMRRPAADGTMREYPLFMAIARRR